MSEVYMIALDQLLQGGNWSKRKLDSVRVHITPLYLRVVARPRQTRPRTRPKGDTPTMHSVLYLEHSRVRIRLEKRP